MSGYRLTRATLSAMVDTANRLQGFDPEADLYAVEGAFTLSGAYGGHAVHRYSGPHGGVSDLTGGHRSAKETERFLSGLIHGLRISREVTA